MTARLVALASGGGRTIENLQSSILAGKLDAEFVQVISSSSSAGVVQRCAKLGLPCESITKAEHPTQSARNTAILNTIRDARPDWVLLAGWLLLLPIPRDLEGKVLNIHPALLPGFGGKGFYGHHVHEAIEELQRPLSGCTLHFASAEYDRGPVLIQEAVLLKQGMSADEIADAVFAAECRVFPEGLSALLEGRARWKDGKVTWN